MTEEKPPQWLTPELVDALAEITRLKVAEDELIAVMLFVDKWDHGADGNNPATRANAAREHALQAIEKAEAALAAAHMEMESGGEEWEGDKAMLRKLRAENKRLESSVEGWEKTAETISLANTAIVDEALRLKGVLREALDELKWWRSVSGGQADTTRQLIAKLENEDLGDD